MSSGTSYNGWPANSDPSAIGVVQNQWFPAGAKAGDVTTVLAYVAREFHARVEPIVAGWCWGYTYKANVNNPSQLSCHASGTALDINAPDHPNGSGGTFTSAQRGAIYEILDEVWGSVSWLEGYDEMHFEICVNAADLAIVAAALGDGGGPPPPEGDWFDMATEDDLRRIIDEVLDARCLSLQQIHDDTAGILRADEFKLDADRRSQDQFNGQTRWARETEFDQGNMRADVAAIRAAVVPAP